MIESTIKSTLIKYLSEHLKRSKVLRHEDRLTAGIPDISITWNMNTSWLEVKLVTVVQRHNMSMYKLKARQQQTLTAVQLAVAGGRCWHVLYVIESDKTKSTWIVHPQSILNGDHSGGYVYISIKVLKGERVSGFQHDLVVEFIRRTHDHGHHH